MNRIALKCSLLSLMTLSSYSVMSQIKAVTECFPTVTKSVCGVSSFEREKFINMAGSSKEAENNCSAEQAKYLFEELGITFGRSLGMVKSEYNHSKSLREDSERAGYTDLDYLQEMCQPTELIGDYFNKIFGESENTALHDAHDTYPPYMPKYNTSKSQEHKHDFPENSDAAGELVAHILKYKYTDFTRPKFYEPVNEPTWEVWSDSRFVDMHTQIKRHVDGLGLDVEVGGPCLSVSSFYGNNYASTKGICQFMDDTNFGLDFYSFHSYDYYRWNRESKKFEGEINSGAPLEGVFDALASYSYNTFGREFSYVATEHGGYMSGKSYGVPGGDIRQEAFDYYANTYFPGEGFEYELERRSVDNFLMISSAISNTMVYMNQPHIVKKAVPFILLDTSKWDPYYYATLLVRDNFDKTSDSSVICPLIYFYEFFKGVEGEFVHSRCNSGDLQHLAYANDDELILLYHNVSNEGGEVSINLNDFDQKIKGVKIRRVGRYDGSLKPYLTEEQTESISNFSIAPQESVAIFISTKGELEITEQLEESVHYATEQRVQFVGAHTFELNIPDSSPIEESLLRVGINRKSGVQDGIRIKLNGVELSQEKELSADRYTGNNGYTTTRMISLPKGAIKEKNSVEVSFDDGGEGGVGAVVVRALTK